MLSCLAAAFFWAIAVSLFRPGVDRHGAAAVNLFKCAFATVCFWLWAMATDQLPQPGQIDALGYLALSGVVGMSVGDALLFLAVGLGGVQRALVFFNTAPIFALALAVPVYGEWPSAPQLGGIVLVVAGVLLVVGDPKRKVIRAAGTRVEKTSRSGAHPFAAAAAGLAGALCQAVGIILSYGPLQEVATLPASAVRLTAAVGGLIVIGLLSRPARRGYRSLTPSSWPRLALPSFIGTVVAVYFMVRGMAAVTPGISATLLATPPLFSLPIARFVLKEALGPLTVIGTVAAVAGVALISL